MIVQDGSVLLLNDGICASDPEFAGIVDDNIEPNDDEKEEEDESIAFED